jgi:multiple sugar transport system ATP-binding protein
MPYLQLGNITKKFPGCLAVDDVSMEIEKGEFLVLLGPSGCGKTTTLRIIAGLELQSAGKVVLDGRDVSNIPPEKRDIAMVFQNLALYPQMTVYNNISFCLKNMRLPKEQIDRKVQDVAERLEIAALLDRLPQQLSGGQKQRVALARALVRNPKVFLLDEPLASLDAKLRTTMRSEFKLLHKSLVEEGGAVSGTFIYVTHDQVEALTLGSRIAVLNNGRVEQLDTPSNIYRFPKNVFTATFVGSPEMNLIEGTLHRRGDKTEFLFKDLRIETGHIGREALAVLSGESHPAILGVRPEFVQPVAESSPGALRGELITVEPMGPMNLIIIRLNHLALTGLVSPDLDFRVGENLSIAMKPECLHFFHPESEQNLRVGVS